VEEDEMRGVFNLGLGFLLVVPDAEAGAAVAAAERNGQPAWTVGKVVAGEGVRFR
jgi:phosphoribosylformylglycinamidine cyclo-ligase